MTTMADAKLKPTDIPLMQRTMNRHHMVAWINADLINRASNDIDKSTVFYDQHMEFMFATRIDVTEELWTELITRTAVRFWSAGVR